MQTLVNTHSASVLYKRLTELAKQHGNSIYPLSSGAVLVKDAGGIMHTVVHEPKPFAQEVKVDEAVFSLVMAASESLSNEALVHKIVRKVTDESQ